MNRSVVIAGLAIGAVGAGLWARRRFAPALPPVLAFTPSPVPLLVPGRVAVERVVSTGSAAPLPLVLVLHGVGADERQLGEFMHLDRPARFVFLRAPLAMQRGFQWFPARLKGDPKVFMADLTRATAEVLAVLDAIAAQRAIGPKIVVGYSQGAHLAWSLAATGRFDHVVAAAGALPSTVRPPPRPNVQIRALHGRRDSVVPFAAGRATAKAFESAGYAVKFSPQPLAAHGLSMLGPTIGSGVRGMLSIPKLTPRERAFGL